MYRGIWMTPIEASEKVNGKTVYSNLQDKREKHKPKYNLGDLVRTADIRKLPRKMVQNFQLKIYSNRNCTR